MSNEKKEVELGFALQKARNEYLNECASHEATRQERDSLLAKVKELEERNLKLVDFMSNHSR